MFERLGLIGCGLMGGSFALALKRAGLVQRVVGYSRSPASSRRARELGVIDEDVATAAQAATGADLVLLAVPVAATESTLRALQPALAADTLIMDVGSTKADVAAAAERALGERADVFVPCHPITGREVAGVEHADPHLYRGTQVIVTPTGRTPAARLEQAVAVWRALGCKVLSMPPAAHDAALAAVSHLPHLLAFAFMNSLVEQADGPSYLSMAGPGFRDFSRIAAGDPALWRDVLIANREQIGAQLRHFQQALADLQQAMDHSSSDVLMQLIERASTARAGWAGPALAPADPVPPSHV
ncbi:prephenate dehydrogenase/arogenate dehydrogenase family protein [Ottowia sp.]|uniref:prephenate dehydrogenase n=1 Tax=Ottowia sp. TaxID=1898956 RepID=UPI002C45DD12|nr:prephenate dehydrogenase/arogenate dehydrogenase family protein [Ottowia sp.]HRN74487.1 prephenate dehydrogenase/arogenate dehydrogenase family protein [Ottowia sp.]HRQ02057.1 prephenate dehydrogenase/arogenate dehydrogenase family protein [Ottowia sp.]